MLSSLISLLSNEYVQIKIFKLFYVPDIHFAAKQRHFKFVYLKYFRFNHFCSELKLCVSNYSYRLPERYFKKWKQ